MAGLTGLLNVAKVGLLTHQINLQTTGHNVANVNTDGYSRQNVTLSPRYPTPTEIGSLGNGVEAREVIRDYDRFITTTLFDKTSTMSGLKIRQSGMKIVEGVFNEVDENGMNQLLNQFWTAWDDVANNAEGIPERTTLLQRAALLAQGIRSRYHSLVKQSSDIDLNIDSTVRDINMLASQIAELNVQIVSTEAGQHMANDLRDQRDELIRKLSELADIHYFETKRGAYTVLIGHGNPLVEDDRAWNLELRSGRVHWVGTAGQSMELTADDIKTGELGGWMDIKSRISPRDTSVLTGSHANTTGGQAIKQGTAWTAIDGVTVSGPFTIQYSGSDQSGSPVAGSYTYTAGDTVGDLMAAIEANFGVDVDVTIDDEGRLVITDLNPGDFPISFQIESVGAGITGLNLGKFDGSYPLNYLEQLNKWGTELIRAVNTQHSQGSGLIKFQELSASNAVIDAGQPVGWRSSGLNFSEAVQDGSFEIWLYDSNGQVIDSDLSTPLINDPVTINITADSTTLSQIQAAINGIQGLTASTPGGHLVIGVDGASSVAGFSFGRDSSGVLAALGLNCFFTGHDAASIGINQDLIKDQRLIAAARVAPGGQNSAVAANPVRDTSRPLGSTVQNGTVTIDVYSPAGTLDHTETITISDRDSTSLDDVITTINSGEGVRAAVENGKIWISTKDPDWTLIISDSGNGFLDFLGISAPVSPQAEVTGAFFVERTFEPFSYFDTGISAGSFQIDLLDSQGNVITSPVITLTAGVPESLDDIAGQIDAVSGITAQVVNGRLKISAEGTGSVVFHSDSTGLMNFLDISTSRGGEIEPADNANALEIRNLSRITIENLDDASLNQAYQGLVGTIGIHSRSFQLDYEFSRATVAELQARRDEVSGVSLDEEMANLIKSQQAYSAAARLIKVADELFVTLLEVK
ncbi:MAG TPA: flagellar hook-associated protein FlgK [Thermodesulfobacteriaceae bacterium]|nr:flagellar hook-associated protein FlgK [Thermodesulfobacteriaceae bacterium]